MNTKDKNELETILNKHGMKEVFVATADLIEDAMEKGDPVWWLDVEIKALDSEYQAKKVALDSEYQMKRTKVFKDAIAKLNELKNVAMDKHDLDSAKRIHERMEELSKM